MSERHPALSTRACELFGVELPIVQTGMGWVSGANLTAAQLEAADLRFADLRGSCLYQAQLWRAQLADAQLAGAFTAGTLLQSPVRGWAR